VYDFASDKITCAIFELSLFSVLLFSALLKTSHDEIKIDIKQIMISFVKKYFLGQSKSITTNKSFFYSLIDRVKY
jgi:hypothetical protein